ncbi:MAG: hypothetical protein HYS27_14965 [Deltaproteobacteria bacterium]|nr:hypothetical protein [Deltaproteobacteria bacterium]
MTAGRTCAHRRSGAALVAVVLAGCVAELPAPPEAPTVVAPALTNQAQLVLRGTKQASTAITLSDGEVLVPLDEATTWSAPRTLRTGSNAFSVIAVDALERASTAASVTVLLDDDPPQAPVVEPITPTTLSDELTLLGTKGPGDRLEVNGSVRPTGGDDTIAFAVDVALLPGTNVVRLATLDSAGNESDVVELTVERVDAVPFTVTTPPTTVGVAALTLSGTRGAGVEVLVDGTLAAAADTSAGAWSHGVTLDPGANHLDVVGRIALERDSEEDVGVDVFFDDQAPDLTVAAPLPAALIDQGTIAIAGTAQDDTAITVEVCAGVCATDAAFAPAMLTGTDYAAAIDLSGRLDLPDGALADVVVRATDIVQRRTTVAVSVLIARAPVTLVGAGGVDLASGDRYVEARAFLDADAAAWVQLDVDGPPWLADTARISDAAAVSAASPRIEAFAGGAAAVVLEDSPAASLAAGEDGLVYAEVTPVGATRVVAAQGDVGAAVGSADLVIAPGGTLIAFSRADQVLLAAESAGGMAFDAPVVVSDATTLSPAGVRLARLSGGAVIVLWAETSDRDGTLDDVDVVARVLDDAGAAQGPIALMSGDGDDSIAPAVVPFDGDTALVGWLEAGAALVGTADAAALIAGTAPTVVDGSAVTGGGVASALVLAADAGRIAVCWLDDGAALVGAGAPGLVVRTGNTGVASLGAPTVVSTAPVTSASCGLSANVLHAAWTSSGSLYLQPRVLP